MQKSKLVDKSRSNHQEPTLSKISKSSSLEADVPTPTASAKKTVEKKKSKSKYDVEELSKRMENNYLFDKNFQNKMGNSYSAPKFPNYFSAPQAFHSPINAVSERSSPEDSGIPECLRDVGPFPGFESMQGFQGMPMMFQGVPPGIPTNYASANQVSSGPTPPEYFQQAPSMTSASPSHPEFPPLSGIVPLPPMSSQAGFMSGSSPLSSMEGMGMGMGMASMGMASMGMGMGGAPPQMANMGFGTSPYGMPQVYKNNAELPEFMREMYDIPEYLR